MNIAYFQRNFFRDFTDEQLLKIEKDLKEQLEETQFIVDCYKSELEIISSERYERGLKCTKSI